MKCRHCDFPYAYRPAKDSKEAWCPNCKQSFKPTIRASIPDEVAAFLDITVGDNLDWTLGADKTAMVRKAPD